MIIAYLIAATHSSFFTISVTSLMIIILFNVACFACGVIISYLYFSNSTSSTLASTFEYGMFDTALTIATCASFFRPEDGVVAALISITQNILGFSLATIFRLKSLPSSKSHLTSQ
jgi:hypothetical protein